MPKITNKARTPSHVDNVSAHSQDVNNTDTIKTPVPEPETYQTVKEYRKKIQEYWLQLECMLVTSRFNTNTLLENAAFRSRNPKVGCVYSCPIPITKKIPQNKRLYVLEMNNTTNKIAGIGMINNRPIRDKYKVYYNMSYNRYVYIGRRRISRETMTDEEEEIMRVFDVVCFKGAGNMKRGHGITAFPIEILFKCSKTKDLVEFVRQMFDSRIHGPG